MVEFARRRGRALIVALSIPALALVPLVAAGQPKPKPKAEAPPSDKYDPDNITAISQFMETIAKANQLYMAKDTTAAIDMYKKAVQLNPRNAFGHYMLAEAYLGVGNLGEADAAMTQALANADARDPALRARVLFLAADMHERNKRWEQARAAWQAYTEQVAKMGGDGGTHPQTAAERIRAVQRVLD